MDGLIGNRILECSDGHLFVSRQASRLFGTLHLGPRRMSRCPVDGQFRMMRNVDSRTLDPLQLAEAQRNVL